MNRGFYLSLAARGLRMPIGTDLILREQPDPDEVVLDGFRLGRVVETAARRYRTPLAIPLMDLRLEKLDLLHPLGLSPEASELFQFDVAPTREEFAAIHSAAVAPFSQRQQAHLDAIRYIADRTELAPIGMSIGPFSLMTRLIKDPITPLAMAGAGMTSEEDPGVLLLERCLELSEFAVQRSVRAQLEAGAKAIFVCEPAANIVYLSPRHLERRPEMFSHFVLEPNLRLRQSIVAAEADLIFHDCGELTNAMVQEFGHQLHPVILSLGSSRQLWADSARVPPDVVLYGNLPTKSFYSDAAMPDERVREITAGLVERMHACRHPHILGSECDVLDVPESAEAIRRKVDLVMSAEFAR